MKQIFRIHTSAFSAVLILASTLPTHGAPTLRGSIVDADSGELLAARLYIKAELGAWYHATSASKDGVAIPYDVRREPASVEVHTTLSSHPFVAELPPGTYNLTAEHGKEYMADVAKVTISEADGTPLEVTLKLQRWTNLAEQGWFSGDTHVHRRVAELPTLMLAEDLNVGLPLTSWVTDSRQSPSVANKNPERVPPARLIEVDPTHVIWPINTEYEIFTIDGKQHTLGAVFILNHREAFTLTAPPVKPIAAEARRQGALLDLDKHNWPWSMMLMPTMKVHLFELTNNHLWRTDFLYKHWYPEHGRPLQAQFDENGEFTERGWIDFGFKNYYALLNCGFDMKPSAGTASGVHPVPLGFGRVYVKTDGAFSYEKWITGLTKGKSFVTTGPMLVTEQIRTGNEVLVRGTFESSASVGMVEIIKNGEVAQYIEGQPQAKEKGGQLFQFETKVPLETTSWIAARGFEERPDKRPRFAHTAPVHHKIDGKPLRPLKSEVGYLIKRVENELTRHRDVLPQVALTEYRDALEFYRGLLNDARP